MRNISFSGPEGATTAARTCHPHPLPPTIHTGLQADGGCCGCAPPRTARVANRTENGAYSVLAVFGQSKSKGAGEKKQQLWPVTCAPSPYTSLLPPKGVGVCVCAAAAAVGALLLPHFIVFVVLPSSSGAGVGHGVEDGRAGRGGLGAALFEEFMAFRDVSMCVPRERHNGTKQRQLLPLRRSATCWRAALQASHSVDCPPPLFGGV